MLGAGEGLVLVDYAGTITAYALASGEERWSYQPTGEFEPEGALLKDGRAFLYGTRELGVLSIGDGAPLWQMQERRLLALGAGGVWTMPFVSDDSMPAPEVTLHYPGTGKVRQLFKPDGGVRPTNTPATVEDCLALRSGDGAVLLHDDGSIAYIPRMTRNTRLACAAGHGCLLVGEYPGGGRGREGEHGEEAAAAPDTEDNVISVYAEITCYETPGTDLKVRWRRTINLEKEQQSGIVGFIFFDDAVYDAAVSDSVGVFRLNDGFAVPLPVVFNGGPSVGLPAVLHGSDTYFALWNEWERRVTWYHASLSGGTADELDYRLANWQIEAATDGALVALSARRGFGQGYGESSELAVWSVDQRGLPIEGETRVLAAPDRYSALYRRFAASPAPLADRQLMMDLVAAGSAAQARILEQLPIESAPQLDALLAAAIYTAKQPVDKQWRNRHGERNSALGDPRAVFFSILQDRVREPQAAQAVRWLEDPSLEAERLSLVLLTARCGGPEAAAGLERIYKVGEVARHSAPEGPLVTQHKEMEDPEHPGVMLNRAQLGQWAEAVDGSGARYAVFPARGLRDATDLYVAVDADGDGTWDEVLPTGLSHVSAMYDEKIIAAAGAAEAAVGNVLRLEVRDGNLYISHNQVQGEGDFGYLTERREDVLSLAEVRRDSDGDGLTDRTEALLFTDPANPDTDGDGLKDAEDPTPNANPSAMGPVERGVARVLEVLGHVGAPHAFWQNETDVETLIGGFEARQPWLARYLRLHGCGPVAFSSDARRYGVVLPVSGADPDTSRAVTENPAIHVGIFDNSMSDRDAFLHSVHSDEPNLNYSQMSQLADIERFLPAQQSGAAQIVTVEWESGRYDIWMTKIGEEFYPYHIAGIW